jgi:hypothetical protein
MPSSVCFYVLELARRLKENYCMMPALETTGAGFDHRYTVYKTG